MKNIHEDEYYWFENDWRKRRQKGPYKYILLENGLIWGVLMSVFLIIWNYIDEHGWSLNAFNPESFLKAWIIALLVFSVGGAFFGAVKWFINEKRLKKYDQSNFG